MSSAENFFLFDPADRELADTALLLGREREETLRKHADSHPRGIVELTESYPRRMLRYMAQLLDNSAPDPVSVRRRISALRALRDELFLGLEVPLRINTARVVLTLLKELLRSGGDREQLLQLAHDLHTALLGNPLFIRSQLRKYFLVEMPEEWSPASFDEHVHDANTKGRKSPAQLVMDGWIKGIRKLQVIYYDFVPPEAAEELLSCAELLGMELRIGVEFHVLYRDHFVELIWTPRGFTGADDFVKFLNRRKLAEFNRKCRCAALYRQEKVLRLLEEFNRKGRLKLQKDFSLELPEITKEEFLRSIPSGQPTPERIANCIATACADAREAGEGKKHKRFSRLTADLIREKYLGPDPYEKVPDDLEELPEINRLSPKELISELRKLPAGFRLTLSLSGVPLEHVIELLYDCRGEITRLEIFNLKDALQQNRPDDAEINELRHALNSGNVIRLKSIILSALRRIEKKPHHRDSAAKLRKILRRMPRFIEFYARTPLGVSIGSDSAGNSSAIRHGMGFVVTDTLTHAVQKRIARSGRLLMLPLRAAVSRQISILPGRSRVFSWIRRKTEWGAIDSAASFTPLHGNVASLGGSAPPAEPEKNGPQTLAEKWHYCSTTWKSTWKILAGFAAAQLTFLLNGDNSTWWVLTWFGAAIWLGITLVRNIVQLVLAGGGFRSSTLLKWGDFLSWHRIADSLFYTGLSVPLLNWLVKDLLLARLCGWSADEQPLLVYAGIGIANGLYLTGHNLLRAFPRSAIWGNWLRVPLSIPLAVVLSSLLGGVLALFGISGIDLILQQWAAVISKLSSDCVGGVVEGFADRRRHLSARIDECSAKFSEFYRLAARLELLQPEQELSRIDGKSLFDGVKSEKLMAKFYVNALDLMYFWLRQPQGAFVLRKILLRGDTEERRLFRNAQEVLKREKKISEFFLGGAFGENFGKALAFYLHNYRIYLCELDRLLAPGKHNHEKEPSKQEQNHVAHL